MACLLNGMYSEKCQKNIENTGFSEVRLYSSDASSSNKCQKSVSETLFTARCVPEANFFRFSLDFGSLGDPFGSSGGLPGGFWSLLGALWAHLGGLLGALGTLLDRIEIGPRVFLTAPSRPWMIRDPFLTL